MIAETTTTPLPQLPDARIEKPEITVLEPLDVEVEIHVPMPVKSVRLGKIIPRMVKAKPCVILDGVSEDD